MSRSCGAATRCLVYFTYLEKKLEVLANVSLVAELMRTNHACKRKLGRSSYCELKRLGTAAYRLLK
jgi:hypothetical protein